MALVNRNFSDIVTFSRASTATYRDSTGTRQTAAINAPRLDFSAAGVALGFLIEEQRTNFFLNSGAPATQTITLSTTGSYTLWIEGTGSIAVAAGTATGSGFGTATAGTPVTFSITAGGTVTCTVTGTVTIAQLENGAFATSYIPTTGASATRAADLAPINTLSPWFNPVEGTLLVEFVAPTGTSVHRPAAIFQNAGGTDRIEMRAYSVGVGARAYVNDAGVTQADFNFSALTAGSTAKGALAYKANNFAAVFTGQALQSDALGTVPTTIDRLNIGSSLGANWASTWIRKLTYYPTRLSDATLTSLVA